MLFSPSICRRCNLFYTILTCNFGFSIFYFHPFPRRWRRLKKQTSREKKEKMEKKNVKYYRCQIVFKKLLSQTIFPLIKFILGIFVHERKKQNESIRSLYLSQASEKTMHSEDSNGFLHFFLAAPATIYRFFCVEILAVVVVFSFFL